MHGLVGDCAPTIPGLSLRLGGRNGSLPFLIHMHSDMQFVLLLEARVCYRRCGLPLYQHLFKMAMCLLPQPPQDLTTDMS